MDAQDEFDLDDALAFQKKVQALVAAVRALRASESEARKAARCAARSRKDAMLDLEYAVLQPAATDALAYRRHVHCKAATVAAHDAEAVRTRQEWLLARARRLKAVAKLQAAVAADREPMPLFERPAPQQPEQPRRRKRP